MESGNIDVVFNDNPSSAFPIAGSKSLWRAKFWSERSVTMHTIHMTNACCFGINMGFITFCRNVNLDGVSDSVGSHSSSNQECVRKFLTKPTFYTDSSPRHSAPRFQLFERMAGPKDFYKVRARLDCVSSLSLSDYRLWLEQIRFVRCASCF